MVFSEAIMLTNSPLTFAINSSSKRCRYSLAKEISFFAGFVTNKPFKFSVSKNSFYIWVSYFVHHLYVSSKTPVLV